ncbi:hypothetical protein ACFLTH_04815 [Bacteroidota bacterium]
MQTNRLKTVNLALIVVIFSLLLANTIFALTSVSVSSPSSNQNFSGSMTLTATTNDDASNVTFNWTQAGATVLQVTVINDSSNTLFTTSFDTTILTDGIYNLSATATNESDDTAINVSVQSITIDNSEPTSTMNFPSDTSLYRNGLITLNATVTDATTDVNTVRFNVTNSVGSSFYTATQSGTSWTYVLNASTLSGGNYTISVLANDTLGNLNSNTSTTMIINTNKPPIYVEETTLAQSSIRVYGYMNVSTTSVTVFARQEPNVYTASQLSNETAVQTGSAVVNETQQINDTYFFVNKVNNQLPTGFGVGNYTSFPGLETQDYLLNYRITYVEEFDTLYRINISSGLKSTLAEGQSVNSYNQSKPTGWFNISVNLHPGKNNITVVANKYNTYSTVSDNLEVYSELVPPVFNLTQITEQNFTTTNPLLNFSVSDLELNLTSLYVNITLNNSIVGSLSYNFTTVTEADCNGETDCDFQINVTLAEGNYNFTVIIEDVYGNSVTNETSFTIIPLSGKPIIWPVPAATNESKINITGYVGVNNTLINATSSNGELIPISNYTTSTQGSNLIISTETLRQNVYAQTKCLYVNKSYNESFDPGDWIEFANHYKNDSLFARYNITNRSNIFEGGENQYYTKVCLQDNLSVDISEGTGIEVHDSEFPAGWFEINVSLRSGENSITIKGIRSGNEGPESDVITIYYDDESPDINTSATAGNSTSNTPTIYFTITDDYEINLSTLNISTYNHDTSDLTLYNLSNVSCPGTDTLRTCTLTTTLEDGNYTINISVDDIFNHNTEYSISQFIVKTFAPTVSEVDDQAVTTTSNLLFVNWTNMSSELFFSHYQVALGGEIYPTAGYNDVLDWFNVSVNYVNQTWNISEGYAYYFHVRMVDLLENIGNVTSSNGIVYEDNTPPEFGNITLIGTSDDNSWTNSNSLLQASWNFTDNETGLERYEYAVGNDTYPLTGWNSIVDITSTTFDDVTPSGLSLEENVSYYFSVRARNNYQYGYGWSDWYSSSTSIKVDTTKPSGGTIYYGYGAYTSNAITITYGTGEDNYSGINRAALMSAVAPMDQAGTCGGYASYNELTNVTPITPGTVTIYDYSGLQNGNCYRFGLYVWDEAGNRQEYYLGNQIYNLSVDATPPQTFTVTDDGHITGSTSMDFSWSAAVDAESGIDYYEYSLQDDTGATIVGWTNNGLTSSVNLVNVSLVDEHTYYLIVRAWNNLGLQTNVSSDGIIYLDLSVPNALTVMSVDDDTDDSDGWIDFTSKTNTTINLTGEQGLSCVWSYYDIAFTQPAPATNYSWWCDNTANSTGQYTCEPTQITEEEWTIYVTCRDAAGNKQTQLENTEVTFIKENAAPTITINSPENDSLIGINTGLFDIEFFDASDYNIMFYWYNNSNNELLLEDNYWNATRNGSFQINEVLDFTGRGWSGEMLVEINATDEYNNTSTESATFIIDGDNPIVVLDVSDYYSQDFNFTIRAALYNNLTYNITNSTGSLIQNNSWTYAAKQNITTLDNVSVDVDALAAGTYTIYAEVVDNESNVKNATTTFIVDKTAPEYKGTVEVEPTTIYENETVTIYLNWKELVSLDEIWVRHNANGSYVNYTATATTPGTQIYENATRYKLDIPAYLLETNETVTYTWHARDSAENEDSFSAQTFTVMNRNASITTNNLSEGWENVTYQELIFFTDLDDSQTNASYFDCGVEGPAGVTVSAQSDTVCLLSWVNPTSGTHSVNITVNDTTLTGGVLGSVTSEYNLTILPTVQQNNTINSSHTVRIDYEHQGEVEYSTNSLNDVNLTIPSSKLYNLTIKIDSLVITTNNYNATNNLDLFFQLINNNSVDDNETDVGSNRTYKPLEAYALRITSNHNGTYNVGFNYSEYEVASTSNLGIFKYGYIESTNTINYTDNVSVTTTLDTTRLLVYATVSNFSTFVLTYDSSASSSPSPPNSPGGSSSSSRSSSSSSYYILPPTCNDNMSNQGETGIDCGGPCDACVTCHDGIKNQDETGVDCGGSCNACSVFTCTDEIMNDGETGVDCGGPCRPCPGCNNNYLDAGEEGMDCGGVCSNACEVTEKPVTIIEEVTREEKVIPKYLWIVIAGIILMGGIVAMVVYKKEEKVVQETQAQAVAEEQEIVELRDEERDVMSRYIFNYLSQGLTQDNIKNQLAVDGFKAPHIDTVMAAVLRDKKILEIQDYFDNYTKQGYSEEELRDWVLQNKFEQDLVEEAIAKRQQTTVNNDKQ